MMMGMAQRCGRQRSFIHVVTGDAWETETSGDTVTVRSRSRGRETTKTVTHADRDAALGYAAKEEFARLKKGFVLFEPDARPGQPRMHSYLARPYTGTMVAADVGSALLVEAAS